MVLVAPSILSADPGFLEDEARSLEAAGADWLHLDVMDGNFVPNITFGPWILKVAKKASKIPLDAHLMVTDPLFWGPAFAEAGADYVSVHVETCPHLHKTLLSIREKGARPGIALNPLTPLSFAVPALPLVDLVVIMGVNPGFSGQPFIPETVERVREAAELIRKSGRDVSLEVDGGVTDELAGPLVAAGATVLVSGSFLFKSPDKALTIGKLQSTGS
ncbi:MAG: ribulose-phosphate 3-epimerase [Deltaproteobacteria bacterium]|jgi:ribulose-phosphate 3-epimerase|nr:ribulose-phosphate 3-epimerase [Deltaproteobacteria bacterium]